MRIEELDERLTEVQQSMDMNRLSDLGSSGKVVH